MQLTDLRGARTPSHAMHTTGCMFYGIESANACPPVQYLLKSSVTLCVLVYWYADHVCSSRAAKPVHGGAHLLLKLYVVFKLLVRTTALH
jgi:hypothetical protein